MVTAIILVTVRVYAVLPLVLTAVAAVVTAILDRRERAIDCVRLAVVTMPTLVLIDRATACRRDTVIVRAVLLSVDRVSTCKRLAPVPIPVEDATERDTV